MTNCLPDTLLQQSSTRPRSPAPTFVLPLRCHSQPNFLPVLTTQVQTPHNTQTLPSVASIPFHTTSLPPTTPPRCLPSLCKRPSLPSDPSIAARLPPPWPCHRSNTAMRNVPQLLRDASLKEIVPWTARDATSDTRCLQSVFVVVAGHIPTSPQNSRCMTQ